MGIRYFSANSVNQTSDLRNWPRSSEWVDGKDGVIKRRQFNVTEIEHNYIGEVCFVGGGGAFPGQLGTDARTKDGET